MNENELKFVILLWMTNIFLASILIYKFLKRKKQNGKTTKKTIVRGAIENHP